MENPVPMHGRATFVCKFADGERTRMTVHCPKGLDVARGVKLARYAYESRKQKAPPAMLGATFISGDNGKKLMSYTADELANLNDEGVVVVVLSDHRIGV
jgi:hypothetical protein